MFEIIMGAIFDGTSTDAVKFGGIFVCYVIIQSLCMRGR